MTIEAMSKESLQAQYIQHLESALERVTLSDDIKVARMIAASALARHAHESGNPNMPVFCPACDFRGVSAALGGECPVCHGTLRPII